MTCDRSRIHSSTRKHRQFWGIQKAGGRGRREVGRVGAFCMFPRAWLTSEEQIRHFFLRNIASEDRYDSSLADYLI